MSPSEYDRHNPSHEAMMLDVLRRRFRLLQNWDEPPLWSKAEHGEWEDAWEQFHDACGLLQEEIDILFKEWQS